MQAKSSLIQLLDQLSTKLFQVLLISHSKTLVGASVPVCQELEVLVPAIMDLELTLDSVHLEPTGCNET